MEPIGKPFLADLFAGEPWLGRCHVLQPPWTAHTGKYRLWERRWRDHARGLMRLRRERLDLLVLSRPDPRDVIQGLMIAPGRLAGFAAAGGAGWLRVADDAPPDALAAWPRGRLAAKLAEAITGEPADPVPRFAAWETARPSREWLVPHGYRGGSVLAVGFGASQPLRRWDGAKISAALAMAADRIGFIIDISDGVVPAHALPANVPAMSWRSDLAGLKRALATSDLFFCADSGPMHMAAALATPVVAVFGPGAIDAFGPHGGGHRVIAIDPMPCRPCFDSCVFASPICLDGLSAERAGQALTDALAAVSGR